MSVVPSFEIIIFHFHSFNVLDSDESCLFSMVRYNLCNSVYFNQFIGKVTCNLIMPKSDRRWLVLGILVCL